MKKIYIIAISTFVLLLSLTMLVYGVQAARDTDLEDILEDEFYKDYEVVENQNGVILEDQIEIINDDYFDKFLKLDGILGESADNKHKNEIEIHTYAFGGRNSIEDESSQNLHLNVVKLIKHIDKSSPRLFQAMLNGDKINSGTLYLVKRSGSKDIISTLELKDVMITSFKQYGKLEEICLGYNKISFSYTPITVTGATDVPVIASWNLLTNSKN